MPSTRSSWSTARRASQNGINLLVELAELIQAPVVDQSNRMNFPNTHHLCQSAQAQALIREADLILGLEVSDFWNTVNLFVDNGEDHGFGIRQSRVKPGTKLITISSVELNQKSNYQDFQRFQSVDIGMAGDAEASLPSLIEAVKSALPSDRKAAYEKRGEAMKRAWRQARRPQPAGGCDRLGRKPDQPSAPVRGDLGLTSRISTIRSSSHAPAWAPGRTGSGRWTATISGSAARAAAASATGCRPRSAPRTPTRRSGGSRSRCKATAT